VCRFMAGTGDWANDGIEGFGENKVQWGGHLGNKAHVLPHLSAAGPGKQIAQMVLSAEFQCGEGLQE